MRLESRMGEMASRKKIIFLSILLMGAVLFVLSFVMLDRRAAKKAIVSGDPAPQFRGMSLKGQKIGLSDFRGKVVMIHFWATWCPPCVEEMPTLDKLYRELKNKDFALLAVSVDEDGSGAVGAFLKKNGIEIPVLLDERKAISGLYGTYKLPETFVVDRRGLVRHKIIGPRDWGRPENIRMIRLVLDEQ